MGESSEEEEEEEEEETEELSGGKRRNEKLRTGTSTAKDAKSRQSSTPKMKEKPSIIARNISSFFLSGPGYSKHDLIHIFA